jgi:hypothetical protein
MVEVVDGVSAGQDADLDAGRVERLGTQQVKTGASRAVPGLLPGRAVAGEPGG